MTGLLTCLVLILTAALSAEAVRAGCRRRLMTPVAVRREFVPSLTDADVVGARELA